MTGRGTPQEEWYKVARRALKWLQGDLPDHPFEGLEELDSCEVPPDVVAPGSSEVLDELFPPENLLGIQVERQFVGDRLEGYRLRAGGRVGIATVGDPTDDLPLATVTVKPKVAGSSLLTMLSYALVPDLASQQQAQISVREASLVSLVVLMYLLRLRQLIQTSGLQRAYIELEEDLRGTLRGQCKLPSYLRQKMPLGKAHIVPCRFWELRVDSEPNRALRWGIEVCRIVSDWLEPSGLNKRVETIWRGIAPSFANIPIKPYYSSQIRRLPRSGRFVPYTPVLELLEFLLDSLWLDLRRGQVHIDGFSVEMWEVFERFVVNVLATHMHGQIRGPQVEFPYEVKSEQRVLSENNIFLDALIESPRRLVLDAKWKEAISTHPTKGDGDDLLQVENLHVRNADLFQVVAYGNHEAVQAQGALLVYPVLASASVCRKRYILDFTSGGGNDHPFPIYLIGIPVGEDLALHIPDFVATVKEYLTRSR